MSGPRQPRFTWRSVALEPDSGLSWRARYAACVYCEYANGFGVLDPAPSAATVASRMAVAVRTVDKALAELEAKGWMAVTRRSGKPSRMVLLATEPPQEARRSYARTPARTPAPPATEPREPGEPGKAAAPGQSLSSQLTSRSRHAIAAAVERREKARRGK